MTNKIALTLITLLLSVAIIWSSTLISQLEKEVVELKTTVESLQGVVEIHNNTYIDDAVQLSVLNGYKLQVVPPNTRRTMWSEKANQNIDFISFIYRDYASQYDWDKYKDNYFNFIMMPNSEYAVWSLTNELKISKMVARGIYIQLVYWKRDTQLGIIQDNFLLNY